MKYIQFEDKQHISQLILGCMRMAEKNVQESQVIIQTAFDQGINFFDHADIYGAGKSEEIFAQALANTAISRDQIYLQSKVGIRKGFFDFSKDHILQSVEGILKRLNTDYLDSLLLHRPDTLMEPEEVAEAFELLYQSGKVRSFGVSNQHPGQMQLLQKYIAQPLKFNQLEFGPAHTPMIDFGLNVNMKNQASINHDLGILEYCRLHDIIIQPWSPFQIDLDQGLFMASDQYQDLVTKLNELADVHQSTLEGMVIAWMLRHPAQFQPVIGSMNPERIQRMAQGTEINLSRPEWYEIYRSAGNILP